jgi:hypothetical protein
MDPLVKDVPESMKLQGPANYILWSYKVKMLLLQEDLWKYIEPHAPDLTKDTSDSSSVGGKSGETGGKTATTGGSNSRTSFGETSSPSASLSMADNKDKFRARRLIISTVRDSLMLSIIHILDPEVIWLKLKGMCQIQSSSCRLALREELYTLRLAERKTIAEHLQKVNLLVTQLAGLGIPVANEDLIDIMINSLPKSWSTFKGIQKGRERMPTFNELEGLMLHEEVSRDIYNRREEADEVLYTKTFNYRGRSNYRGAGRSSPGTRGSTPPRLNL